MEKKKKFPGTLRTVELKTRIQQERLLKQLDLVAQRVENGLLSAAHCSIELGPHTRLLAWASNLDTGD